MAGITITGGQPPRIARVDTGSERPTWIGDAAKLDEQKKNLNGIKQKGGEDLEMCHQVAYYLIGKYLRKTLKNLTIPEAVAWFDEKEHWIDPDRVDSRITNRWRKNMPLKVGDAITPNLPTLIELVDEWLKNANSYTGNLWLGGERLNAAKGHFLKEAMNSTRRVGLGEKLYGPYNRVYIALMQDIVAQDSLGNQCDVLARAYTQNEGGGLLLQSNAILRVVTKETIKNAFDQNCQLVFLTTNLNTQKLKFRLEAYGDFSEGAITLFSNEIYKVSRNYDPATSFDFRNGKASINIKHKNVESGGVEIKDFESLKAALVFGALDLNGRSDDLNNLEEKLLNLLRFSIAGFLASLK
jgi:hypothetical protein